MTRSVTIDTSQLLIAIYKLKQKLVWHFGLVCTSYNMKLQAKLKEIHSIFPYQQSIIYCQVNQGHIWFTAYVLILFKMFTFYDLK